MWRHDPVDDDDTNPFVQGGDESAGGVAAFDGSSYDFESGGGQGSGQWGRGRGRGLSCRAYICVGLVVAVIGLAAAVGVLVGKNDEGGSGSHSGSGSAPAPLCTTPGCLLAAAYTIQSMDQTADPCEDFYQYSCGGWVDSNPIPDDKSRISVFGRLDDQNMATIRQVLEGQPKSSGGVTTKALEYYQACTNMGRINSQSLALFNDLRQAINPPNVTIEQKLANMHSSGISALFSAGVGQDDKSPKDNALFISQSGIGLPSRDYYINKTVATDAKLKAYNDLIVALFTLLGSSQGDAQLYADAVIDFETQLATAFVPRDDMRDPNSLYNPMDVAQLQQLWTGIDWTQYFTSMFSPLGATAPVVSRVVVTTPDYFTRLGPIYAGADPAMLQRYLEWHTISAYAGSMGQDFLDAIQNYSHVLSGTTTPSPRWLSCIYSTDGALGFILGRLFVEETFGKDSRDIALNMIDKIKASFEDNLPNVEWMDSATAVKAKEKAEAIIQKIGYPDWILNDTKLADHYADLPVSQDHFANKEKARQAEYVRMLKDLDAPVDRTRWGMTPATVNAYYNPGINEIVFPAAILQPPFFGKDHPAALNFGGIGVVIGHELTHGFDDMGRKYDKDGLLHNWWSQSSVANFKEKTQCIVDQYSAFTVDGNHVNGKMTLGENIADNGGLTESFRAFLNSGLASDERLPGLEHLTQEQLFFLSYGQVWCANRRPEEALRLLLVDVHSPPQFRVNGAVANTPEFSRAYQCPSTAKLNQAGKCKVW
eukprot:m.69033 g.69033  ORF g.69033 m.69033 type:complete len:765 (+) comp13948_c0_seq3:113-2407(+)